MTVAKELLLKSRLYEEDYDVPDVGTIRVRRLSWEECSQFTSWTEKGRPSDEVYAKVLSLALVDPALSEDEAREWLEAAAGGEIEAVVRHVLSSSGLVEGAQKSP